MSLRGDLAKMGPKISKHYCVCIQEDGTPREISRLGSVVTYKAVDYRSGRPVALQVIPLTSVQESARSQFEEQARSAQKLDHTNIARVIAVGVEDEHIVFITEYLQGETAESWVVSHGPMSPDAVIRIALQVVSALGAAMFHTLAHRSLQPSNIMILPGTTAEGEWPFVKLLNFGLAGLKLYSEGSEPRELAPSISPQFASPEQLHERTVDFRSEIYSLGATMCFLLTGAVPLAGVPDETGVAERVLPSVRQIPKPIRKLLHHMLRYSPEERPQDPVALSEELGACLQKINRRHVLPTRPLASPALNGEKRSWLPRNQFRAIGLATAALLVATTILAALLMPQRLQSLFHRRADISSLGVPIGVPDSNALAPAGRPKDITELSGNPRSVANGRQSYASSEAPTVKKPQSPVQPSLSPRADESGRSLAGSGGTGKIAPNAEQQFTAPSPGPAFAAASPSAARRKISEPRMAMEETLREPPPPAEGPADSSEQQRHPAPSRAAAKEAETAQGDAAEIKTPQDVWNSLQANNDRPSVKANPGSKGKARSSSRTAAAKTKLNNSSRRQARDNHRHSLPQMRVGSMRAEFVGTTGDGNWILQLPNGKTVVTPPVPNPEDAPVEKAQSVRPVTINPRELPVDQRPPVVVMPPENQEQ